MLGLRLAPGRFCMLVGLALGLMTGAVAQPAGRHRLERPQDTGTGAVTLKMLTVRTLRADRPWDPKVCVGCEGHAAPLSSRLSLGRLR